MDFHTLRIERVLSMLSSDKNTGLTAKKRDESIKKYGRNILTKKKKQGVFSKILDSLKEPMILILAFSFLLALGTNIGKYFKSGDGDFLECFGILLAIILSVSITLIMEGSSERAFNSLNKIYDDVRVRIIRESSVITVRQTDVLVGDIIILESGDKVIADGRLIESNSLSVDESALTGESVAVKKQAQATLRGETPLAERVNMVYSGTFIASGNGKMVVTAVGDLTEIGKIASELSGKEKADTPLQQKLNKLGKTISIIGAISAAIVFFVSVAKLAYTKTLTVDSVQELFVSCIILIVAAVPEGLPTIVAVSLALNMIKLAGESALIKKISATETAGAVSVICSDKTGTLTENKMKVTSICENRFCYSPKKGLKEVLKQNFVLNSTADVAVVNGKKILKGSGTECALIEAYLKDKTALDVEEYRSKYKTTSRTPFSSEIKYMTTTVLVDGKERLLIKGAPEVVLEKCKLTDVQKSTLLSDMQVHQRKSARILCFAHADDSDHINDCVYDGFVTISDPIRKEVFKAVKDCNRAGIKVKILTGDNKLTAFAVAKELKIATDESQVVLASEIENLKDDQLKRILSKVTVIARSTPLVKLKVVKTLKSMGEVVAVTGDGINDAPAIKKADVGIAMGKTGSEITKEAADVVLLNDSFATVVKAVSFGRNVYKNLQRFILFQLSVNLSALLFVTVCAVLGLQPPFNTFQLLWINVIMDGPPALTLGLEPPSENLMRMKPVRKSDGIVGKKMLARIIINGLVVGGVMIAQHLFNFIGVKEEERASATFTLFILFQLFNAFNSRELGAESIFKSIGKNKVMVATFIGVFAVHFIIIQSLGSVFSVMPMCAVSWLKLLAVSSLIVVVSEGYKLIYRLVSRLSLTKYSLNRQKKLLTGK